jgi:hypothetical protein
MKKLIGLLIIISTQVFAQNTTYECECITADCARFPKNITLVESRGDMVPAAIIELKSNRGNPFLVTYCENTRLDQNVYQCRIDYTTSDKLLKRGERLKSSSYVSTQNGSFLQFRIQSATGSEVARAIQCRVR